MLSTALSTMLLLALPQAMQPEGDATDPFDSLLRNDCVGALRALANELRTLAPSADEPLEIAELEYRLLLMESITASTVSRGFEAELLRDLPLTPEQHGSAWARATWIALLAAALAGDAHAEELRAELGLLTSWQFIGPFDNERGAGMEVPLPPEDAPDPFAEHMGKVRSVAWRTLPDPPLPQGFILFGHILHPWREAAVLARSWVYADEPTNGWLLLGAKEELRVWHDGRAVFDALGPRSLTLDANAVPIALKAGWNELTLKIGGREGPPAFMARLTDLEERPLHLAQSATLPEGQEPHALSPDPAPERSPIDRPGGWRLFAAKNDLPSLLRRSVFARLYSAAPRKEHPGRAEARMAVDLAPEDPAARYLLGLLLFDIDAEAEERDMGPWLDNLHQLASLDPRPPIVDLWRALYDTTILPKPEVAIDSLDRFIAETGSVVARTMRAQLLANLQESGLAQQEWRRVLAHPDIAAYPDEARLALQALPQDHAEHEPLIVELKRTGKSDVAIRAHAAMRALQADADQLQLVEEVLAEHLARDPWSFGHRLAAAETLLAMGRSGRARALIDEALTIAPEMPAIYGFLARLHIRAGDDEAAADALERELELDFGAEDERRLLEHLRARGAAPFEQEYREPLEAVLARHEGSLPLVADAGREMLLARTVIQVKPDGTAKRYARRITAIRNENGARALDRFSIAFAPYYQEVRVLSATVRHADGTTEQARTGRSSPRPRSSRFVVDLPPLVPGDVVDIEWRRDDLRGTFFGEYFGLNHPFMPQPTVPILESEVVLLTPDELPLTFHPRGFEGGEAAPPERLTDATTRHRYTMRNLRPPRQEMGMPPPSETGSWLEVSSYSSWDAFGNWWWNLIEQEIVTSETMQEKVVQLTADCSTQLDRARAIYDFVVTDIRYNAWEFGVHGYQPYSAPVIFSRGFGDCKDKAILLRAMLGEVGIEAYPVLIRAEDRRFEEDHALAMVNHFNHCIAWLPDQPGIEATFLDGTARHHPYEVLPQMDAGARVVVVSDRGTKELQIPFPTAEENRMSQKLSISLCQDGGGAVEVELLPAGNFDPRFRGRFAGSEEERLEEADRMMSRLFGAIPNGTTAVFSNLEALGEPVRIALSGHPTQLLRIESDGFGLPTTFNRLQFLQRVGTETERESDLLLDVPWSYDTMIEYDLGNYRIVGPLPDATLLENVDLRYERSFEIADGLLLIRERVEFRAHRIPPDRYPALREMARTIDELQEQTIPARYEP